MKRLVFLLISASLVFGFCSTKTNRVKTEIDFANRMAVSGLWQEAFFRWQKSLEDGGESALLHNNMAVALEKMGKFKEAEKKYEKALKLSPGNSLIKENLKSLKRVMEGKENVSIKEDQAAKDRKKRKGK